MDDAELSRHIQRWRRAEPGELTEARSALARALGRRGEAREAFAAAVRHLGEEVDARTAERLALLVGWGYGDPRLECPARPVRLAVGPAGTPVVVALEGGRLGRVRPGDGLVEPLELPLEDERFMDVLGLEYDRAGDLWVLRRRRGERDAVALQRLPGGAPPADPPEVWEVAGTRRPPALVVGVGDGPAVLVERENRQVWLHHRERSLRLPAAEPGGQVSSGAGPGLLAMLRWRSRGGHALHVLILDGEGEVVDRVDVGGVPALLHWDPAGRLHLLGVDVAPSQVWTREEGEVDRPWAPLGPPRDEDGPGRRWRDAGGHLWDCGAAGVRRWPDVRVPGEEPAPGPGEVVPAGPWVELEGLEVDVAGRRLLAWGFPGEVAAWDLDSGARLFLLRERDEVLVTALPDGRLVLVGRAGARWYEPPRPVPTARIEVPGMQIEEAAPGAHPGEVLLLGCRPAEDQALVVRYDLDAREVRGEFVVPWGAHAARAGGFLDEGATLWVAWQRPGGSELGLHDTASGALLSRHELGLRLVDRRMLAPDPQGRGVAIPGEAGPAWITRGGGPPAPLVPGIGPGRFGFPVAYSASGARVAWLAEGGLRVDDLVTGARLRPERAPQERGRPVAFRDEETLLVAEGRRVRVAPLVPRGPPG